MTDENKSNEHSLSWFKRTFPTRRPGMDDKELRDREYSWTMSDERQFFESLYSQRFNIFILVYSLIVAARIGADNFSDKVFVLLVGFIMTAAVGLSLYRACHKLLLILTVLHHTRDHPVRTTGALARDCPWPL